MSWIPDPRHVSSPRGLSAVLVMCDDKKERRAMLSVADALIEYIRRLYPHLFVGISTIGSVDLPTAAAGTEGAHGEAVTRALTVEEELERELAELRGVALPSASSGAGASASGGNNGKRGRNPQKQGWKAGKADSSAADDSGRSKRPRGDANNASAAAAAGVSDDDGAAAGDDDEPHSIAGPSDGKPAGPRRPVRLLCRFEQLCRAMGIVWFPHPAVDMLAVVSALLDDVAGDGMPRTRFASRIVPLQRVTAGYTADVVEAATQLIQRGFVAEDGDAAAAAAAAASAAKADSSSSSAGAAAAPAEASGGDSTAAAPAEAAPAASATAAPSIAASSAPASSSAGPPRPLPLADTSRPTTWAADFSCRNNNSVSKQEIQRALSSIVPSAHLLVREAGKSPAAFAAAVAAAAGTSGGSSGGSGGSGGSGAGAGGAAAVKVSPGPETTVLVEVVGKYAGVSVVRRFRYQTSRRFNVKLMTETEEERSARLATANGPAVPASSAGAAPAASSAGAAPAAAGGAAAAAVSEAEETTEAPAADSAVAIGVPAQSEPAAAIEITLVPEADWDVRSPPRHGVRGAFVLPCSTDSGSASGHEAEAAARLEFAIVQHLPAAAAATFDAAADSGSAAATASADAGGSGSGNGSGSGSGLAIDITHTFTPAAARGKGLAQRLTAHALQWALSHGIALCIPTCSYVSDTFSRRYSGEGALGSSFGAEGIHVQVGSSDGGAQLWQLKKSS